MLAALCLGPLLAVLAAACGGAELTSEEYVEAVSVQLGKVDAALLAIEQAPPEERPLEASRARTALVAVAAVLEQTEPPGKLDPAHGLLVDGITELAADIEPFLSSAASDEAPEVVERLDSLASIEKLRKAQELFEDEGIELRVGASP